MLVDWLREDGLVTAGRRSSASRSASAPATARSIRWCGWATPGSTHARTGKSLDTEALTEWLAGRAGLPYLRIDPLKVDVGRVADVMSHQLRRAAPRAAGAGGQRTRSPSPPASPSTPPGSPRSRRTRARSVRLVVANPLELAALHDRVLHAGPLGARRAEDRRACGQASFEQLVELGQGNKQLDANDQGVVQVVDWLWQYAFDQRASDIHLEPRREMGAIRFRIDGVMHTVYQVPLTVMSAMTARIKLLGRMDVVEKRRPQDGRIKTPQPSAATKWRCGCRRCPPPSARRW